MSQGRATAAWPVTRTALACMALVAGILLLTTGGHTYAIDEEMMLSAAYGVVTRGNFTLSDAPDARVGTYGPGQSLVAAPLLIVGLGAAALLPPEAHHWAVRAAVSWLNPLITGAVAALLCVAAAQLGLSRLAAVAVALIYGLATPAWPHSKTFFAEPLTALLLFGSLVVAQGPGRRAGGWMALAGLLAGLAPAVKIQAGLFLPFLGLWVLWLGYARGSWRGALVAGSAWGLGAFGGLALLGAYQWLVFGNPLVSGYGSGAASVFQNDIWLGLYGLVLSPGKSLLLYAPPLLLWPPGVVLLWRRDRGLAALCVALAAANLLFYARLNFWHGDGAWGPRYLTILLPFLVLPLAPVVEAAREQVGLRLALLLTLILAVPVQLGGVSISLNAYLGAQPRDQQRYFVPAQSPLLGHLRLLARQLGDRYAQHLAPGTLVLAEGFSYSEGDRAAGEQLPRWSGTEARLALRPAGGEPVLLTLELDGCRPPPLPAAAVTLALDGRRLDGGSPCPGRRYRMVLPPRPTTITLSAPGWRPAEAGIRREGELGVLVRDAAVEQGAARLALAGELVPIPPMPAGQVQQRKWNSDYRLGHFDFWWWFLGYTPLAPGQRAAAAAIWLAAGLVLVVAGIAGLRRPAMVVPRGGAKDSS